MMGERTACKAKSWQHRLGFVPCANWAVRDGFCSVHHPDAEAARKARSDARYAAQQEKQDANFAAERARREDATRMAWLADHWADFMQDQFGAGPVHRWIEMNLLKCGGLRQAIDQLRNARAQGSEDAQG